MLIAMRFPVVYFQEPSFCLRWIHQIFIKFYLCSEKWRVEEWSAHAYACLFSLSPSLPPSLALSLSLSKKKKKKKKKKKRTKNKKAKQKKTKTTH